jgi:serine/threonine-protein kinase RsbW
MSYKIQVSCCTDELQTIRDFIYDKLKKYALSDVVLNQLILAVDEICANLMIHAHHRNPDHTIELAILVEKSGKITFEIYDQGKGFNFPAYHEPCIKDIIRKRRKGGVGLLLVKRIMDRIEYEYSDETQRNVYRLQKFGKTSQEALSG